MITSSFIKHVSQSLFQWLRDTVYGKISINEKQSIKETKNEIQRYTDICKEAWVRTPQLTTR